MPVTLRFANVDLSRVIVRPDPLAELGALLHALSFREHHPLAEPLLAQAQRSDRDGSLHQRLNRFLPLYGPLRARFLFPIDPEPGRSTTVSAQLEHLAALPAERFISLAADSLTEDAGRPVSENLRHSPHEQSQFFRRVERISISRLELARDLVHSPETVRWLLIEFLQDSWNAWMRPVWETAHPRLAQHAELLSTRLQSEGITALAERIPEITIPDPNTAILDKVYNDTVSLQDRAIIIAPSALVSPHLHIQFAAGLPVVLQYDIDAPSAPRVAEIFERIQTFAYTFICISHPSPPSR